MKRLSAAVLILQARMLIFRAASILSFSDFLNWSGLWRKFGIGREKSESIQ
jgi:hypothetical protein